jgi:Icc-related predicted phosphoesterase
MPAEQDTQPRRGTRTFRVAAVGDLHYGGPDARGSLTQLFDVVNREADVFALLGDLTTHGRIEQIEAFTEELRAIQVPMVGVLGNHDYEAGDPALTTKLLSDAGVHVLDGDHVVIDGVGFAGTKGFAGGFGRGALAPFGESIIKEFVQQAIDEQLKLENGLRALNTEVKVALLHYAPCTETVLGEPEVIFPFLGSSRLLQPLETLDVDVCFHGHAHHGTRHGITGGGLEVYNVALPLLRADGDWVHIWEVDIADRRGGGERSERGGDRGEDGGERPERGSSQRGERPGGERADSGSAQRSVNRPERRERRQRPTHGARGSA